MKRNQKSLSIAFLFDDTIDSNDGVAQYVKRLGKWLGQNGHRVTYLVGESSLSVWHDSKVYSLSKNLKVKWAGNKLSMSLIPRIGLINRVLKDNNFDVVHVQFPYSPFMSQVVINKLSPQTSVVGSVHIFPAGRLSIWGSKILKIIYGRSLRRFDKFLSVSLASQQYAADSFNISSTISPNIIELASFRLSRLSKKPTQKDTQQIVFLGRLVKRKGCKYLLQAFKLVLDDRRDVKLIIAGDGPERSSLEKLSQSLGIDQNVEFRGYIPEDRKAQLLAQADIACFPSLYGESFGIVLIEAMAAGAGVVLGGNNPGYGSVLQKQPILLVEPKNTPVFAKRLESLLTDENLIKKVHLWQTEEVAKYGVETVGAQVLKVYREAINQRLNSGRS